MVGLEPLSDSGFYDQIMIFPYHWHKSTIMQKIVFL